jgi:predicted oxidoreductase
MKTIPLGKTGLQVPVVAVGCMRIKGLESREAERFVQTALDEGAYFFDHADIYGGGACEEIFAEAIHMSPSVREKIIIQTKCGIRPGISYDFSKEHILSSVEGSLKRLKTDYLDVLLLHRPDASR